MKSPPAKNQAALCGQPQARTSTAQIVCIGEIYKSRPIIGDNALIQKAKPDVLDTLKIGGELGNLLINLVVEVENTVTSAVQEFAKTDEISLINHLNNAEKSNVLFQRNDLWQSVAQHPAGHRTLRDTSETVNYIGDD